MRYFVEREPRYAGRSGRVVPSVLELLEGGTHYEEAIRQFRARLADVRRQASGKSLPEEVKQIEGSA